MVLEAFAAVNLACSVLTFIEFAVKVISKSSEYARHPNRVLEENNQLSCTAERFECLGNRLSVAQCETRTSRKLSGSEKALIAVAQECESIGQQFKEALASLKAQCPAQKWQRIRQALRMVWSKEGISKKLEQLRIARENLVVHLLVVISEKQLTNQLWTSKCQSRLESAVQEATSTSAREINRQIAGLSHQIRKQQSPFQLQNKELSPRLDLQRRSVGLTETLSTMIQANERRRIEILLLHSLEYPGMKDRQVQIDSARHSTFEWLFCEGGLSNTSCFSFSEWLSTTTRLGKMYWIAGKAGSGKSTLMKYLVNDRRTTDRLSDWAGSQRLVTATAFIWNPGSLMQRSFLGLMHSLLHQLLPQMTDLIEIIAPWRWQAHELSSTQLPNWTTTELVQTFQDLLAKAEGTFRICLFVDGLDEIEGDETTRSTLIELLLKASQLTHLKVCVSSRPWLVFKDALCAQPSLHLEQLTYNDICKYVATELCNNERFRVLQQANHGPCKLLQATIVSKANGVFLWVFLVVRDLLQGLRNEDDIYDLQQRLLGIPSDLEEYFGRMMGTLDPMYMQEACFLFSIALNGHSTQTLMTYSYAREESVDLGWKRKVEVMSRQTIVDGLDSMERRLNSRCKGLLEVQICPERHVLFSRRVDFLHRTVKDYLQTDVLKRIQPETIRSHVDINVVLCQARMAQIKGLSLEEQDRKAFTYLLQELFTLAQHSKNGNEAALIPLLDELDQAVQKLYEAYMSLGPDEHWANHVRLVKNNGQLWAHQRSPQHNTFIGLAYWWRLDFYVKEKILNRPQDIRCVGGRPLLDLVLRPPRRSKRVQFEPADEECVNHILIQGASPNEYYGSLTVWGHFLTVLSTIPLPLLAATEEGYITLIALLVKHGANPKVWIRGVTEPILAAVIFKRVFRKSEAEKLVRLLRKPKFHDPGITQHEPHSLGRTIASLWKWTKTSSASRD